jgi:hypothetical protein
MLLMAEFENNLDFGLFLWAELVVLRKQGKAFWGFLGWIRVVEVVKDLNHFI